MVLTLPPIAPSLRPKLRSGALFFSILLRPSSLVEPKLDPLNGDTGVPGWYVVAENELDIQEEVVAAEVFEVVEWPRLREEPEPVNTSRAAA